MRIMKEIIRSKFRPITFFFFFFLQLYQQPFELQLLNEFASLPVVYTMLDKGGDFSDWSVAKMWVNVAAANAHCLKNHVLGALWMESFQKV